MSRPPLRPEQLEERTCPSTYNYAVIAQSGQNGITSIDQFSSINDSGQVAFVGQFADGSNGVFVGNGFSLNDISSVLQSSGRTFGTKVQINNSGQVAAEDSFSGTSLADYVRVWNSATDKYQITDQAGPGTGFDSFFGTADISNDGNVTYVGKLAGLSTVALEQNGQALASLPSPQPYLQPMAANGGLVVARVDTSDITDSPIELFQPNKPATVIAGQPDFSSLGSSPGISDDGQIVAFYGVLTDSGAASINAQQPKQQPPLTSGAGIFLSVNTTSYGRIIVRVSGTTGSGDSAFDADKRVAVTSVQGAGPAFTDPAVTVVFMGTDSVTHNDALFCNRVDLFPASGEVFDPANPASFRVNTDTVIAEVGDQINGVGVDVNGVPGTIKSLNIYDPVNSSGNVAFWVSTNTGGERCCSGRPDPRPCRNAAPSSSTRIGPGRPTRTALRTRPPGRRKRLGRKGCTLTALAMALNYAGFPILSDAGTGGYTPLSLDFQPSCGRRLHR